MSQSNLDLRFNEIKNPVFNNAGFLLWVNSQLKTTKQVLVQMTIEMQKAQTIILRKKVFNL